VLVDGDVSVRQVGYVNEVTDAGAVTRWVVAAEHRNPAPLPGRSLTGNLDEVGRLRRALACACRQRTLPLLRSSPLPDYNEWRPVARVCLMRLAVVDHRKHSLAQGFGTTDALIADNRADSRGERLSSLS
jgi:hypothetical protein